MKTLPQQVKDLSQSTVFLGIAMLTLAASLFCINGKVDDLNSRLTFIRTDNLDYQSAINNEMLTRTQEHIDTDSRLTLLEDKLGLNFVEASSEDVPAHYIKTKDVQGKVKRFLTDATDQPRCILGTNCFSESWN